MRFKCICLFLFIPIATVFGHSNDSSDMPPVTYDPAHTPLSGYKEYISTHPWTPVEVEQVYKTQVSKNKDTKFFIIVNSSLYGSISSSINQYATDLDSAGYTVETYTWSGGTAVDLRTFLRDSSSGLVGVVLIGNLPIAWYEINHQPDGWPTYEDFPCDLYYMDLNGTWLDTATTSPCQAGVFDGHSGSVDPEIWVGRLTAGPLGDEVTFINKYLAKAHKYRTGSFALNDRALIYIDDDWAGGEGYYDYSSYIDGCIALAYPTRVLINEFDTTCRDDYRDTRLTGNYAWFHIFLHSSSNEHFFKLHGDGTWDTDWWGGYKTVNYNDIKTRKPLAFFYNLFCCSNCRYTESNYMGGWYIFADSCGLGAIGSTKTGSMFDFSYFYASLGNHKCLGEAFNDWWVAISPYDDSDKHWYYGLTLLGDPTLVPRPETPGIEEIANCKLSRCIGTKLSAYPNPFSTKTIIRLQTIDYRPQTKNENNTDEKSSVFGLRSSVSLRIYDLSGRLIRSFPINQSTNHQLTSVVWDGRDDRGKRVPSGVYLYQLTSCNYKSSNPFLYGNGTNKLIFINQY